MSILMEYSIFPMDKGESVSKYVSMVIRMLDEGKVKHLLTPMGTIIEVDRVEEALDVLSRSYHVLEPYSDRLYMTAKFDMRKNREGRMEQKIKSVMEKL